MLTSDLIAALEQIAPTHLAEDWDNVGLILGSPEERLDGSILLCIDLTEPVLDEALRTGCSAVIAYHPPIFNPIKRLVGGQSASAHNRTLFRAARSGITIYSPHTSLDAASNGITDWLAEGLLPNAPANSAPAVKTPGADRRALRPAPERAAGEFKIVTFVPNEHLDTVRSALASAGAGLIGDYELCSFNSPGNGTFRGKAGTTPAIGTAETFEQVLEQRLEMICPGRALALALQTLRQFHPYQEPAIDVYPLAPRPRRELGPGRLIHLDHPASLDELSARLKRHLGVQAVQAASAGDQPIHRIGVVAGAGASLIDAALADGCQLFVTGEMKHHEVLGALSRGVSVLLGGHTDTERGFLPRLSGLLAAALPEAKFVVSRQDRNPLILR